MNKTPLNSNQKLLEDLVNQISLSPYFRAVSIEVLRDLFNSASYYQVAEGEKLIVQGTASDRMVYILAHGSFAVYADHKFILRIDQNGLTIGEMAVIDPEAIRSADVVAEMDSQVIGIETIFLAQTDAESLRLSNVFLKMFTGILTAKLQMTTDRAKLYEDAVLEKQEVDRYNQQILSESKDLKQELQLKLEQIKLYSEVVECNQDPILITDAKGKILSANRAFNEVYGYDRLEIQKLKITDLLHRIDEKKDFLTKIEMSGWKGENDAIKKDGNVFPALLTITPVATTEKKDKSTTVLYAIATRDITKQKEYENHIIKTNQELQKTHSELEKTLEELEKSNQIKDQFLSNISTQLKTPLVSLINYGELMSLQMKKAPKNSSAEEYLRQMLLEGKKVEKMVGNLLIMAELAPELSNLRFQPITIQDLVEKAKQRLEQKERIHWDLDPRISAFKADAEKFLMAFVDMLEFALFFKDQTTPVSVQITLSHGESFLDIKITFGESATVLPQLRGEELAHGIEVRIQDAEIHLPRAKRIIELHQGEMKIHTKESVGHIMIRVATDPVNEANSLVKVMIVDDTPFDRKLLKGTIEKNLQTTEVFEFDSQMEALNAINAIKPNLLIVDPVFQKGQWEHEEFLSKLLTVDPEHTSTLVISNMLHDLETRRRVINQGITDFLFKPFTIQDVAFKAKSIIETKQRFFLLSSSIEKAEKSAATDGLTGLYNRKYYDQYIEETLLKAEVSGNQVALIMIDVDNFKHYNDTNGHPLGDVVLTQVARLLRNNVRSNDMVARYGGEEFVVVLPQAGQVVGQKVAEVLRATIEETPFPKEDTQPLGRVTASFGVAVFPFQGKDPKALLKAADKCLYQAKERGRNNVVLAQ